MASAWPGSSPMAGKPKKLKKPKRLLSRFRIVFACFSSKATARKNCYHLEEEIADDYFVRPCLDLVESTASYVSVIQWEGHVLAGIAY